MDIHPTSQKMVSAISYGLPLYMTPLHIHYGPLERNQILEPIVCMRMPFVRTAGVILWGLSDGKNGLEVALRASIWKFQASSPDSPHRYCDHTLQACSFSDSVSDERSRESEMRILQYTRLRIKSDRIDYVVSTS